ncbi:MAG: hypothetical protein MZW92_21285 [Comamonadaceae bacterium]|nr:hypothetical protein [Comamonadaceae bacterium]
MPLTRLPGRDGRRTTAPSASPASLKYPLRKMLTFAVEGVTSFSIVPLRLDHRCWASRSRCSASR